MLFWKMCSLLGALSFLGPGQAAKRLANLEFESLKCSNYSGMIKKIYCNLAKLDDDVYAIDGNFELYRDLPQNAEMHIKIRVRPPLGDRIINFMDLRLNICDFLNSTMTTPIARSVVVEMRRAGNLPYSCPIKGNVAYGIKNSTFSSKILPPYTPQFIKFNFTLNYFADRKLMAQFLLQGSTGQGMQ